VRMIRAVRFAASHNLAIEPATWETLCALSSTISRAAPARLYEEMLKLFLLGSARPVFTLLDESGLLAALFPGLGRMLNENGDHRAVLHTNLECLDRLYRNGLPPSPALFLAALFGPGLEEETITRQRDGIPHVQALSAACAVFMEEFCKIVCIPGRIGGQLRGILALQPSLHRMPPRRPASLVGRPGFADAISYLCLIAKTREENRTAREWWQAFLETPAASVPAPQTEEAPAKRRRKKRRRRRLNSDALVKSRKSVNPALVESASLRPPAPGGRFAQFDPLLLQPVARTHHQHVIPTPQSPQRQNRQRRSHGNHHHRGQRVRSEGYSSPARRTEGALPRSSVCLHPSGQRICRPIDP
jgi:hypothetical protein